MSLFAAALALGLSTSAWAQPPAASPEDADRLAQAMQLYDEGVKAAKAGQWDKARTFYLHAWSVQKHWQIAANLGLAEANAGKHRDAAEHLSYFLREAPNVTAGDRKKTQELIDKARTKVGALTVAVSPEGAEVLVDGQAVGTAPIKGEVFVEPGAHVVEARLDGYKPAQATKELQAGGKDSLELHMVKEEPTKAGGRGLPGPAGPVKVQESRPNMTVIVVGAVVTAVAAGAGLGFNIIALREQGARGPEEMYCSVQSACDEYNKHELARANFTAAAMASYIVAGAFGAGTLTYALVKTLKKPESTIKADLLLGPGTAGAMVTVHW